jgi:4-hydroxy-3-methylbut-2-enyl diphosphate reductase
MIEIEIDKNSGFCFGVVNAIESAERELQKDNPLYCLGDLVHNNLEMKRLKGLGLKTIHHAELAILRDKTVLLRAHGEPPSTYIAANQSNIKILDATCPVVLHLQKRIKDCYEEIKNTDTQLVIYGKKGHAEVNGLVGQTGGNVIIIEKPEDLECLDFRKRIVLFSQTTKPLDGFGEIVESIQSRMAEGVEFRFFDTICRQVANRLPKIKEFAAAHDWIYFVAGAQSSNGKMLFEECKKTNPNTVFISESAEIKELLPKNVRKVGVCGATSTPKWLMEEVAERIRTLNINKIEISKKHMFHPNFQPDTDQDNTTQ